TLGSVRATVAARDAAAMQAVHLHQVTVIGLAPVAIGMWLWLGAAKCPGPVAIGMWRGLAWANGRGQDWARPLSAACFALISLGVLAALAQGTAALAPATMIAAAVVWALGLSSVVLIFTPAACRYYRPQAVQQ